MTHLGLQKICVRREEDEADHLRLLLIGKAGSGKSATGNTIFNKSVFQSKISASPVTKTCQPHTDAVNNRRVTVIDTPDFFFSDRNINADSELKRALELCSPGAHVILLILSLSTFTEQEMKVVSWFEQMFGSEALRFTLVLFTRAEKRSNRQLITLIRRHNELSGFINRCGGRVCGMNNKDPSNRRQVTELMEKIERLLSGNTNSFYTLEVMQETERRRQEEERREEEEKERKEREHQMTLDTVKEETEIRVRREEEEKRREKERKEREHQMPLDTAKEETEIRVRREEEEKRREKERKEREHQMPLDTAKEETEIRVRREEEEKRAEMEREHQMTLDTVKEETEIRVRREHEEQERAKIRDTQKKAEKSETRLFLQQVKNYVCVMMVCALVKGVLLWRKDSLRRWPLMRGFIIIAGSATAGHFTGFFWISMWKSPFVKVFSSHECLSAVRQLLLKTAGVKHGGAVAGAAMYHIVGENLLPVSVLSGAAGAFIYCSTPKKDQSTAIASIRNEIK